MTGANAPSRRFPYGPAVLALMLFFAPCCHAQYFPGSSNTSGNPARIPGASSGNADLSITMDEGVQRRRKQRVLTERLKRLQADSVQMVELAEKLKASLAQHPNTPTEDDRKLMQQIEHLAHNIRTRMVE